MRVKGVESSLAACESGSALTETALLCFFIYAPVLMMVLILGDVSLERGRAQMAAAYMAWSPDSIPADKLRSNFFPDSDRELGTGSLYSIQSAVDGTSDAPGYFAATPSGDNHDRNIWAKLQLLAVGEWSSGLQWQQVNGQWELVTVVHRSMDSDARWLVQNEVVAQVNLPSDFSGLSEGENIPFAWSGPTTRGVAVTSLLNHRFSAGSPSPLRESDVELEIWHTSVFFDELDRYSFGEEQYDFDLPEEGGKTGIMLRLGSGGADGDGRSAETGKTWLFNPDAKPSGSQVRANLYDLSPELFSYQLPGGFYITMRDMQLPLSTIGNAPEDQRPFPFVQPGDPRALP